MKLPVLLALLTLVGSVAAQEVTPALKAQVLLDRAHFSVGEIDGEIGSTTTSAVKFFQEDLNLPITGELDAETLAELEDGEPILQSHTLSLSDVSGPFGGKPRFANLMEKLGERFQSNPNLLKTLNPTASFVAGEVIQVPAVGGHLEMVISKIVVNSTEKSMKVFDLEDKLIAYYPTTLGKEESIPYGEHKILTTIKNPHYKYKKKSMSSGPNNYVGNMWMALSEPHYGIHGSPEPSKISKQQSAGCIRLTNWDAHEVANAIAKNAIVVVQQ